VRFVDVDARFAAGRLGAARGTDSGSSRASDGCVPPDAGAFASSSGDSVGELPVAAPAAGCVIANWAI